MATSKLLPSKKFVDVYELADILGVSKRSVWRYRAANQIPAPHSIPNDSDSQMRTVWMTKELREWIAMGCPSADVMQSKTKNPIRGMMMSHKKRQQRIAKMQSKTKPKKKR